MTDYIIFPEGNPTKQKITSSRFMRTFWQHWFGWQELYKIVRGDGSPRRITTITIPTRGELREIIDKEGIDLSDIPEATEEMFKDAKYGKLRRKK